MIDLTRFIVIVGYLIVLITAGWCFTVFRNPVRRVAAVLFAVMSTGWVLFYIWIAAIDLSENPAMLQAATLMSRLAHLPTIGAAFALLIMLHDTEKRSQRILSQLGDRGHSE